MMRSLENFVMLFEFSFFYQLLVSGVILIYLYVLYRLSYWRLRGVGGPFHLFPFMELVTMFRKSLPEIQMENSKRYNGLWGSLFGLTPILSITDPEMLKHVFIEEFASFPGGLLHNPKGFMEENGLILVHGRKWKRLRSILAPSFTPGKLKYLSKFIVDTMKDLIDALTERTAIDGFIHSEPFWFKYTLDAIAKSCIAPGASDFDHDNYSRLIKNFRTIADRVMFRMLMIHSLPKRILNFFNLSSVRRDEANCFQNLIKEIVQKRKSSDVQCQDLLQSLIDSEMSSEDWNELKSGEKDFETERKLTEIACSIFVLLFAGAETTSTLLCFLSYRLAINPHVQEKLYQELINNDISDYNVLLTLPYLDAVIKESLRIDPPVIFTGRDAVRSCKISANLVVEKGCRVQIPIYAIHHDPNNYPDPESFIPERFLPENRGILKPFTFLSFGGGPRNCIGKRFALLEAKIIVSRVITKFELFKLSSTPENPKFKKLKVALTPTECKIGIKVRDT